MKTLLKRLQNMGPWNKGRMLGQKAPLTAQEIWSIRMRVQDEDRERDLVVFNLAIDSKLRACDLLQIKVSDIASGHSDQQASHDLSAEDRSTCSIRDHTENPKIDQSLGEKIPAKPR